MRLLCGNELYKVQRGGLKAENGDNRIVYPLRRAQSVFELQDLQRRRKLDGVRSGNVLPERYFVCVYAILQALRAQRKDYQDNRYGRFPVL